MPRRDGTGPQGAGPFTGRGNGNCAVAYTQSGITYGYAGAQGVPIGNFWRRCWNGFCGWFGRRGGRNGRIGNPKAR